MKTFKILFVTCLIASLGLSSCKKDKDEDRPDDHIELTGTWKLKDQKMEVLKDGKVIETETEKIGEDFHYHYFQFTADGKVTRTDGDALPTDVQKGTYSLKGNELHLLLEDEEDDDMDEFFFTVSRHGDALSFQWQLDLADFIDDDDDFYDIDDEIDADQIRIQMNLEKTNEDPAQVKHVILGSWELQQIEIQGLIDYEVVDSETMTIADGLDASTYVFNADGTVTMTSRDKDEDEDEDEVATGTYTIEDGQVIIDLDEDNLDIFAFAFDGQNLTLTQKNLSAEDLFDFTDEFEEFESYNVILTLKK